MGPKLRNALLRVALGLAIAAGLIVYGEMTKPVCGPDETLAMTSGLFYRTRFCAAGHH